jgi:hypothetical protein
MFYLAVDAGVKMSIENVTLCGLTSDSIRTPAALLTPKIDIPINTFNTNNNTKSLVKVEQNNSFEMKENSKITGNYYYPSGADGGGGVYISGANATLTMSGNAAISGNYLGNVNHGGGGVFVDVSAQLTMLESATISGNYATGGGGGVVVYTNGQFTMSGNATISGNYAGGSTASGGGGVFMPTAGQFTMSGNATISGNYAIGTTGGGGVALFNENPQFTMKENATISGNSTTDDKPGGGVRVAGGTFTMTSGMLLNNTASLSASILGAENFYTSGGAATWPAGTKAYTGTSRAVASDGLSGVVSITSTDDDIWAEVLP